MELRERLGMRLKEAMRDKDARRVGTLRLINAAIKDQDIALRAEGRTVGDAEATAIMAKMVKQRQESARAYEEGGRLELAEAEGATSVRDMGKVMGVLKAKYPGQIDFGAVGPLVKNRLN